MTAPWSTRDLRLLDDAGELEIAVERSDGTRLAWTPIWVVCAGEYVYVRSWHRRGTGWFGQAVRVRRAGIRVSALEADVTIEDLGSTSTDVTAAVDAAYRVKYGAGADSMVTTEAAATTLRFHRE